MRKRVVHVKSAYFMRDVVKALSQGLDIRKLFVAIERIRIGVLSDAEHTPVHYHSAGKLVSSMRFHGRWTIVFCEEYPSKTLTVIHLRALGEFGNT